MRVRVVRTQRASSATFQIKCFQYTFFILHFEYVGEYSFFFFFPPASGLYEVFGSLARAFSIYRFSKQSNNSEQCKRKTKQTVNTTTSPSTFFFSMFSRFSENST